MEDQSTQNGNKISVVSTTPIKEEPEIKERKLFNKKYFLTSCKSSVAIKLDKTNKSKRNKKNIFKIHLIKNNYEVLDLCQICRWTFFY